MKSTAQADRRVSENSAEWLQNARDNVRISRKKAPGPNGFDVMLQSLIFTVEHSFACALSFPKLVFAQLMGIYELAPGQVQPPANPTGRFWRMAAH